MSVKRRNGRFDPEVLVSSVIALPLLKMMEDPKRNRKPFEVIIDVNLQFPLDRRETCVTIAEALREIAAARKAKVADMVPRLEPAANSQYIFTSLPKEVIRELVRRDRYVEAGGRMKRVDPAEARKLSAAGTKLYSAVYRIWPDFEVLPFIDKSSRTVKADAARFSFSADGEGIVWAVMDSGIEGDHPHFKLHRNLEIKDLGLQHQDFTTDGKKGSPLADEQGHGTHVAGIIAGEVRVPKGDKPLMANIRRRDENGKIAYGKTEVREIAGMAPKAKLVSLKVLARDRADNRARNLIKALQYVQEVNGNGRLLRIHGVNMSVGYPFDAEWFACGQSPLCVEVNRLVRSGVVVVVAAGNSGYGFLTVEGDAPVAFGMDLTINDPGNSEAAITVGATHRDSPHVYGVSYFSSKGPTGDGRLKPDLVAPGEKIVSCAAGDPRDAIREEAGGDCHYRESSGTSMAAPHVSGVIAAFLSVRREFVGEPERVKAIFTSTATDLKRERYFQGSGLVDLMRAIQSV